MGPLSLRRSKGLSNKPDPDKRTAWNSTLRPKAPEKGPSVWDDLPDDWKSEAIEESRERPDVYGEFHAWIRMHPCELRGHPAHRDECTGGGSGEHVKTVGSGGKDWRNEYPTCAILAAIRHNEGFGAMKERYGFGREEAERSADMWAEQYIEDHGGPPAYIENAHHDSAPGG